MKQIVALYKAYRGGEWFGASLRSIRTQCAGAAVVLSDRPWAGSPGGWPPENCRTPLAEFRAEHPEFPVEEITSPSPTNTEEQYCIGMDAIGHKFGGNCGVLLVDTDEVWAESDLVTLRIAMSNNSALVFRSGIYTYVRSPIWRVHPKETARSSVALAHPGLSTGRSRLANIHQLYTRRQIFDVACSYHHIGYVRTDPEEITAKLANNDTQDKVGFRKNWVRDVWHRLPEGRNIHPQTGFERCWPGIAEADVSKLPKAITDSPTFWDTLKWHVGKISDLNIEYLLKRAKECSYPIKGWTV